MATGKVEVGSFSTAPDGTSVDEFAVSRRKELITIPWMHQLVLAGKCYHCDVGTLTTPISMADTTLDPNQPRVAIDVPAGTTIMPLTLDIYQEDATGTDNEYIWITQTSLCGAGTSTEITPLNMRSDLPETTTCTVYSFYTADCATQTGMIEFARFGTPHVDEADRDVQSYRWSALTNVPPAVVGPGAIIMISAASTAPAGYVYAAWAELKTVDAK